MEQQELLKLIIVILAIGGLIALLGGILTLIDRKSTRLNSSHGS